ncbi:MAG: hypothetical protein ACXACI_09215 [Candidatus Hodarchaeales archaeon]|jgi:hypothetical protein
MLGPHDIEEQLRETKRLREIERLKRKSPSDSGSSLRELIVGSFSYGGWLIWVAGLVLIVVIIGALLDWISEGLF